MDRKPTTVGRFSGAEARAWVITDRARQMAEDGGDIIDLGIGDPDFDTPKVVCDSAIGAIRDGHTHYAPIAGVRELRKMIAARATEAYGKDISEYRVVVFPGAQSALFATVLCLAETGDDVLILEPYYATYPGVAQAGGASVRRVPMDADDDFRIDIHRIADALTPDTQAILINSPANPTGIVAREDDLTELVALCRSKGVWIVSDEVYASLTYDGSPLSPIALAGGADITFAVSSLSKSHAMTGWRIGWAIAPEGYAHHLVDLSQSLLFGVNRFVQDAAITALAQDLPELETMKSSMQQRRDALVSGLAGITSLRVHRPTAGMFLVVDVSETGLDGQAFAAALLDSQGVAVVPGFAFGPSLKNFVRIGFLRDAPVLKEACRRIAAFVERCAST